MKTPWRAGVGVCVIALVGVFAISTLRARDVEREELTYQYPQLTSEQIGEAKARIAEGEPFDFVAWSYGFHPTDIGLYHFGRQIGTVDWEAEPGGHYLGRN